MDYLGSCADKTALQLVYCIIKLPLSKKLLQKTWLDVHERGNVKMNTAKRANCRVLIIL